MDNDLAEGCHARAVDVQFLPRAIGVGVADEPEDGGGDIRWERDAAKGEFRVEVMNVILARNGAGQARAHVADGERRRDDVDAHAVPDFFFGEGEGQGFARSFGHIIRRAIGAVAEGGDAGNDDDVAAVMLAQLRQGEAR